MGKKTVAELEAENLALKEQMASQPDVRAMEAENLALTEQNDLLIKAKEEADARLVQAIDDMEKPLVVNGQVQAEGIKTFTGDGYTQDLKRRGIKIVSKFDIETLRTFINSDWSPSMVMEQFGLTKEQLQSYVFKLSKKELRDRPIKLDFRRDMFGKEG